MEHNIPDFKENSISFAAYDKADLVGAVLGFDVSFRNKNEIIKAAIGTGLSTEHRYRAKGISQYLQLQTVEAYIEDKYHFVITFMDIRHAWKGSSFRTYVKEKSKFSMLQEVAIMGKPLNLSLASKYANLSPVEEVALGALSSLFQSTSGPPKNMETETGSRDVARDYADFIHEFQGDNDIKRYFSEEELARKISFAQGRVNGVGLAVRGGG